MQLKSTNTVRSANYLNSLKDIQVYDEATRGPLGSLLFLWHFRKAPWVTYTAFIGCVVTILAIAADPFTQQILRYDVLPTEDPGIRATLQHAHIYDFGSAGLGGGSSVISKSSFYKTPSA